MRKTVITFCLGFALLFSPLASGLGLGSLPEWIEAISSVMQTIHDYTSGGSSCDRIRCYSSAADGRGTFVLCSTCEAATGIADNKSKSHCCR